jgi:multidrug resistance efflux pump
MMKWILIALGLTGLAVAVYAVAASAWSPPIHETARPAIVNPYPNGLAASGLIEGQGRNVRVAAPEAGLVWNVMVRANDTVSAGAPLFQLDPRTLDADLARAKAAAQVAEQSLQRLQHAPRSEDIAPLAAAVKRALAHREHAKTEFERLHRLRNKQAVSEEQLSEKANDLVEASARLEEAEADIARLRAGTWEWDLRVAERSLGLAQAEAQALHSRLERLTVRAPGPGTVLKVNLSVGEFAAIGAECAVVLADLSKLHVRAQVDEQDAVLLRPGLPAVAVVTGKVVSHVPLTMLAIEPLAVPKKQLTGSTQELVDTRVVEVLFAVQPGSPDNIRLYPGQIVDVFIDAELPKATAPILSRSPEVLQDGGRPQDPERALRREPEAKGSNLAQPNVSSISIRVPTNPSRTADRNTLPEPPAP